MRKRFQIWRSQEKNYRLRLINPFLTSCGSRNYKFKRYIKSCKVFFLNPIRNSLYWTKFSVKVFKLV